MNTAPPPREENDTGWDRFLPALGLIVGAAILSLCMAVLNDGRGMGVAITIGAGIGLVIGSVVWLVRSRG